MALISAAWNWLESMRVQRSKMISAYRVRTDRRHAQFERQRKIIDPVTRERMAADIAATLPHSSALRVDPAEQAELERRGLLFVHDLVSPQKAFEIREYFKTQLAFAPYRKRRLGKYRAPEEVPSLTHISHYEAEQILDAPHLVQIANDPRVLSLVESYLGAKPTIAAWKAWWSTPYSSPVQEHPEWFHRDVDDFRFLKLFIFLTDVDEHSGRHVYVPGTHKQNTLTALRRYTDEEVADAFGEGVSITGPAGTSFLEATYGLHKGCRPSSRPRLLVQPLYTLRPCIYAPKAPIRPLPPGLDPYVNRLFLG